jgi:hypothetical protein
LIVQGGFALVFHRCIYHILIRLNLYYLIFLYCLVSLLLNSFQYISLFYLHTQMLCGSILSTFYHSLFLFCLTRVPSDRPTITVMFCPSYLYISIHTYVYKIIYVFMFTIILQV